MPNLMQLVERNTCALSKQLLGEDLSQFITHNEHQEETVAVDPHILNWIKSSCLIRSVKFVKIITWKFISWSQGKFLVFAAGQSRTSRGNTCHVWSCFFWCPQILEKNMSHTQRQRWCVSIGVSFFSWIDLQKYGWRVKKSSSCMILYSLYLHRQHTSNHPCTFRTAWLFHNVVPLFVLYKLLY